MGATHSQHYHDDQAGREVKGKIRGEGGGGGKGGVAPG